MILRKFTKKNVLDSSVFKSYHKISKEFYKNLEYKNVLINQI